MTIENTKLFLAKLEQDPDLSNQLADYNVQSLVRLGREADFEFDENDLRQLVKEMSTDDSELSEEELEAVAGGVLFEADLVKWMFGNF